jgi:mono/diheme cytochrome c family protein
MLEAHPMSRSTRVLALVVAGLLAAVPAGAAPALTFKSVKVELPDSYTSFRGPGADALNNNCLSCHSAGMVLNQPALPTAVWRATVEKMIHTYMAPIDGQDVAAIVDYLSRTKGVH